jgi:hypothetical protein
MASRSAGRSYVPHASLMVRRWGVPERRWTGRSLTDLKDELVGAGCRCAKDTGLRNLTFPTSPTMPAGPSLRDFRQ